MRRVTRAQRAERIGHAVVFFALLALVLDPGYLTDLVSPAGLVVMGTVGLVMTAAFWVVRRRPTDPTNRNTGLQGLWGWLIFIFFALGLMIHASHMNFQSAGQWNPAAWLIGACLIFAGLLVPLFVEDRFEDRSDPVSFTPFPVRDFFPARPKFQPFKTPPRFHDKPRGPSSQPPFAAFYRKNPLTKEKNP